MGSNISKLGCFAICLLVMILFQGCSTNDTSQNQPETVGVTTTPVEQNPGHTPGASSPTQTSIPANDVIYIPKFHTGDIIDVPDDEVGSNLAPGFGMVIYGRWISNISYDNQSLPIYNFSLIYWNETGQWYYTGYMGWKYAGYIDQVDNATLLAHIDT